MAKDNASKSSKTTTTRTTIKNKTLDIKAGMRIISRTINEMPIIAVIVAEFIATFAVSSIILLGTKQIDAFYLALAIMGSIMLVGNGIVHLNPAITIAEYIKRKVNGVTAIAAILAQLMGSVTAWAMLNEFMKNSGIQTADAATKYGEIKLLSATALPAGQEMYIFFAELIGTMIIALGATAAIKYYRKNRAMAAMAYGLAAFVAMSIFNTLYTYLMPDVYSTVALGFMNPAFATAASAFNNLWVDNAINMWPIYIYIIAPVLGAIIGSYVYQIVSSQRAED